MARTRNEVIIISKIFKFVHDALILAAGCYIFTNLTFYKYIGIPKKLVKKFIRTRVNA